MPTTFIRNPPSQTSAPKPAETVYFDTKSRAIECMQLTNLDCVVNMEVWGSIDGVKKDEDKVYCLVGRFQVVDKQTTNFPLAIVARLRLMGYRFIKVITLSGNSPQVLLQTGV